MRFLLALVRMLVRETWLLVRAWLTRLDEALALLEEIGDE